MTFHIVFFYVVEGGRCGKTYKETLSTFYTSPTPLLLSACVSNSVVEACSMRGYGSKFGKAGASLSLHRNFLAVFLKEKRDRTWTRTFVFST
jgi:hypothetical protein